VPESAPKLYGELADWFHLLTAPEDYAEEAELYRRLLVERADGPVKAVLELGSGGGNNASHLKRRFTLMLVDRSPEMLALSRRLNPECEHLQGDMRDLRLGRTFDAVFVHDALAYITEEADLNAVVATAFAHCRPGGSAVFVPDYLTETFEPRTGHGGHDSPDDGRGLRYVEWVRGEPGATAYVVDFAYLLREGERVRIEHDRHFCAAFSRKTWLNALEGAGFEVEEVTPDYDDPSGQAIFACRRT
jgi:SAM-dependent methyltransferase